jgi:HEAT repeat protein
LAILSQQPSFRERYLLLEPAAKLAATDPALVAYLAQALVRDEQDAVRARAARVSPVTKDLLPALLSAADEPHVRVREAAILNLSEQRVEQASALLLRRAANDPWPFVRAASVRGLVALKPPARIDVALGAAAENDPSPEVRRPALLGLGSRNAKTQVEVVRDRLDDDDEDPYVRAAAAESLGMLCDLASIDDLARRARVISRLTGDEAQHVIGGAALNALGRIAPADLKERLRVFEGPEVPPWAKQAAAAALDHPEPCRR